MSETTGEGDQLARIAQGFVAALRLQVLQGPTASLADVALGENADPALRELQRVIRQLLHGLDVLERLAGQLATATDDAQARDLAARVELACRSLRDQTARLTQLWLALGAQGNAPVN
jgi:hypothetical protein